MKGRRLPSEGRFVGGCPCGFWSVSNCRYVQARGVCCAPLNDRPALPSRLEASR